MFFNHNRPCTLSSLFCQLSSRLTISSMQWDKVDRMPAVVALKVMASPLKSIPLITLGLAGENTAPNRKGGHIHMLSIYCTKINMLLLLEWILHLNQKNSHFSLLPLLLWLCSPSGLVVVRNSSSSSSTTEKETKITLCNEASFIFG